MAELITGYGVEHEQQHEHQEAELSQYLTFLAGEKTYAIGILEVNEIIEIDELTDVPMMPGFIRGVINLRGDVVPVIDLAARMHRGEAVISKRSCIVLVNIQTATNQSQPIGLLVDFVNEIVEIEQDHIQPAPDMGEGIDTRFIEAMGRVNERFMILLATEHMLSNEQLGQLQQLTEQHRPSEPNAITDN